MSIAVISTQNALVLALTVIACSVILNNPRSLCCPIITVSTQVLSSPNIVTINPLTSLIKLYCFISIGTIRYSCHPRPSYESCKLSLMTKISLFFKFSIDHNLSLEGAMKLLFMPYRLSWDVLLAYKISAKLIDLQKSMNHEL